MLPDGWNEAVGRRLFDEALARYIDWREACAAVRSAYDHWSLAAADRSTLFAVYNSALDQEASAAAQYGAVLNRLAAV
jgi:hypothetical protein